MPLSRSLSDIQSKDGSVLSHCITRCWKRQYDIQTTVLIQVAFVISTLSAAFEVHFITEEMQMRAQVKLFTQMFTLINGSLHWHTYRTKKSQGYMEGVRNVIIRYASTARVTSVCKDPQNDDCASTDVTYIRIFKFTVKRKSVAVLFIYELHAYIRFISSKIQYFCTSTKKLYYVNIFVKKHASSVHLFSNNYLIVF